MWHMDDPNLQLAAVDGMNSETKVGAKSFKFQEYVLRRYGLVCNITFDLIRARVGAGLCQKTKALLECRPELNKYAIKN